MISLFHKQGCSRIVIVGFFACIYLAGCEQPVQQTGTAELQVSGRQTASTETNVPTFHFTDVTIEAGLHTVHLDNSAGQRLLPETMVGGIAFVDIDRDQKPDVLAYHGTFGEGVEGAAESLAIYRNLGTGRFEKMSASLEASLQDFGFGVIAADISGDGWPDIVLTALGKNRILLNHAGERFEDVSGLLGFEGQSEDFSIVASPADVDLDGDLDLLVGTYVDWSEGRDQALRELVAGASDGYGHPKEFDGKPSLLYLNNYPQPFSNISKTLGIRQTTETPYLGKVLGVLALDFDEDGLIDFLVGNDTVRNFAFKNLGAGRFDEEADALGFSYNNIGVPTASMGIDEAWLGPDLDLHVVIGNFSGEMSTNYRFDDPGVFTDIAPLTGLGAATRRQLTFGVLFADLDLDGRPELIQVNGHVQPDISKASSSESYRQAPQIFWNCGATCPRQFISVPADAMGDLSAPLPGRGLAAADYDGDGDLDLLVSSVNEPLRLYRNDQSTGNNWLRVALLNDEPNSAGIGSTIELLADDWRQKKLVKVTNSYLSQSETTLTFGLGKAAIVDELTVRWPDGELQKLSGVKVNQELQIQRVRAKDQAGSAMQ